VYNWSLLQQVAYIIPSSFGIFFLSMLFDRGDNPARALLFKNLNTRRQEIRNYAVGRHSWDVVGEVTRNAYAKLLGRIRYGTSCINSHPCVQRAGMDQ